MMIQSAEWSLQTPEEQLESNSVKLYFTKITKERLGMSNYKKDVSGFLEILLIMYSIN